MDILLISSIYVYAVLYSLQVSILNVFTLAIFDNMASLIVPIQSYIIAYLLMSVM